MSANQSTSVSIASVQHFCCHRFESSFRRWCICIRCMIFVSVVGNDEHDVYRFLRRAARGGANFYMRLLIRHQTPTSTRVDIRVLGLINVIRRFCLVFYTRFFWFVPCWISALQTIREVVLILADLTSAMVVETATSRQERLGVCHCLLSNERIIHLFPHSVDSC